MAELQLCILWPLFYFVLFSKQLCQFNVCVVSYSGVI